MSKSLQMSEDELKKFIKTVMDDNISSITGSVRARILRYEWRYEAEKEMKSKSWHKKHREARKKVMCPDIGKPCISNKCAAWLEYINDHDHYLKIVGRCAKDYGRKETHLYSSGPEEIY